MKSAYLFCVIALCSLSVSAQDDSLKRLTCKGTYEQMLGGDTGKKPTIINVVFSPKQSLMQIDGFWGCTLSMAKPKLSSDEPDKCFGVIPVSITNDKINYMAEAENSNYSATTSFSLNRFSGSFTAIGMAYAKPESRASWSVIHLSAEMVCESATQKF